MITRLVVSVDTGRPYLFVGKQNFLKNISNQKTPYIFVCNKINCLCFTAGANENVSIYTNQFISQRMQIHVEKKKEIQTGTCGVNDSPLIKITKIAIIIVFALISSPVFARKTFGNVKTSNFVSKNSARIENFMS